ncbi:MAG: response regulator transcription factor [Caldilineaceae bacterium]
MKNGLLVLVVDADPQTQRLLQFYLTANGYPVVTCATAAAALAKIPQVHPDLILLDPALPDTCGLALLHELRTWLTLPILVLSQHSTTDDQIAALDAGADDFLPKPLACDALLARMRAVLRRIPPDAELTTYTHGDLHVDLTHRLVTLKGQRVQLTPHEYALLRELVQHAGTVLPHRQLLSAVWGPAHADAIHYGRVYIAQLRQKLEADPASPQLILTEPRVGYRLTAPEPDRPRS